MYPGILPSTAGYLPFPTYPRSASTACILALPRFMYPGIHPLAPGCLPFPTYPRSASTTTFPKFMYPGIHPLAPGCLPFPISLRSAVPSPDQCLQESTYVTSGELPSPLPQGQRYSCRSQDHVSRNPSVYRRISSVPYLPKVSVNCMYSCLAQVHVSRNPSARSRMSPLPHLPKASLNNNLPQVHVSRNSSVRSRMSSLPHFPKVGGAFPGSVSPGVHLCHLSGLPSPLPQGQRYSCRLQDHVSRNPSVYRRISSLPHLPKVSLNCMYSCIAQVHASRNPSVRSRMSPLPHLPKVSLNNNLPQVHVSRNPSARSGCLPFPISLRLAVPSPDQCLQEPTCVT
nr:uncharacterized protein LOC128706345 [Cherax quadricarinatus]